MLKYQLTIGLNDKDTKMQKFDTITAYKLIEQVLKQYVSGYTIYECNGGYKHDNGTFVSEKSLRVELMFTNDKIVHKIVEDIKSPKMLNQESIAVEVIDTKSELW